MNIKQAQNTYTITTTNKGKTAFLLNAQNLDNHFQLLNAAEIPLPITLDAAILIEPNKTASIILTVEELGYVLVVKFGQEVVYIEV